MTNDVRWQGHLVELSPAEARHWQDPATGRPLSDSRAHLWVRWHGAKHNYDQHQPDQWYRRSTGGALIPTDLLPMASAPNRNKKPPGTPSRNAVPETAPPTETPLALPQPPENSFPGHAGEQVL